MYNPCTAFHAATRRRRRRKRQQRVQQEHRQAGESSGGEVQAEDQSPQCPSCCCAGAAQGKTKSTAGTQGSPLPTSLMRMKQGRYEKLRFCHSESGCLEVYLSGAWHGAVPEAAQPGRQTGYYSHSQTRNHLLKMSSKAALLQKQPCPGSTVGSFSPSCSGLDPDISISSMLENRSKDEDESKQAHPCPPQSPLRPPQP